MTNEEILTKAIEKAKLNGFNLRNLEHYHVLCDASPTDFDDAVYYYVIFSHDFAKAFWGEGKLSARWLNQSQLDTYPYYKWQYHLQQMVLEEEPLKYLEKFLDK